MEIVPQAIEDARRNARLNGMENVEFFVGKAEEVLPEQYEKEPDLCRCDRGRSPKKGLRPDVPGYDPENAARTGRLCQLRFRYLARDLRYLVDGGYEVKKVRGCDMFPQSGHCECVVRLERR